MCPRRQTRVVSLLLFLLFSVTVAAACCSPLTTLAADTLFNMDGKQSLIVKGTKSEEKVCEASGLEDALKYFDANFFSDSKVREMAKGAIEFNVPVFRENRKLVAEKNGGLHDPSVLVFNSSWGIAEAPHRAGKFNYPTIPKVQRPTKEDDIAFMTVLELGELIRTKQITSLELTNIFLERLKRYNHVLEAVISFTEDLAYSQAKKADDLLEKGVYLGPLHGIPYGLKDIIAVPGYKTTWGSKTFKDQVLDIEAWVYKRLKSAGAVLVAKLVSGSLAYDDIWFGGRTRNPWNIEEFSTGSSAGPASSTSAGLVPFAIGSETAGSMTYPAARCGITCLRPTFGSVGRTGVMSISESLDKLGPFCRSATDCSVVLDAIRGKDPDDLSSRYVSIGDPFSVDISKLTVGYLEDAEMDVVHDLSTLGVKFVPFKLNYTVKSVQAILNFTMDVDMLVHFDQWQRSLGDDEYEAQDQWPVELRRARLVPAVDYIQAQRARGRLIREVRESFTVDAFIGNATDWEKVCLGNLVGMPVVVVPTGFKSIEDPPEGGSRRKTTITTGIYAPPDHDHIALALAMAYQSVTDHHLQKPPIDDLGLNDPVPIPGLGVRYEPFITSMLKPPMPTYGEVVSLLQSYETRTSLYSSEPAPYTAFVGQTNASKTQNKGHNSGQFSSKGGGFAPANQPAPKPIGRNNSGPPSLRENTRDITCQICGKRGHVAIRCWHRFNHSVQPDNLPHAFSTLNFDANASNEEWTSDTGASSHMTSHEGQGYTTGTDEGNKKG